MNAYDMLAQVRSNLNETTADHWTDIELMRHVNFSQNKLAMHLSMAPGNWLIKVATVTPASGVITLPSDCAKPLYIEEVTSGTPVLFKTSVQDRRQARQFGTSLNNWATEAYTLASTIEVNQSDYATQCYLWYQMTVPDLITATADTGSTSNSIIIPTTASPGPSYTDDYYNNSYLEVRDGTGEGTRAQITDYVASTRALTVTGTFSTDSVFGMVSRLPEQGHPLMVLEATCSAMAKPSSHLDADAKQYFSQIKTETWKAFVNWISSRIPGAGRHTRITNWED